MQLSQWAAEYRHLSPESSAAPGRWTPDRTPYMREIMDAITAPQVPKVVVMSAAQTGKTENLVLNTIGYHMHFDPCPVLVVLDNGHNAEWFNDWRLLPMLRDTPVLAGLSEEKGKLQREYPGGALSVVGADAACRLQTRPARVVLVEEVDRIPPAHRGVLSQVSRQQAVFRNPKQVLISTPYIKGQSQIEAEYKDSTQEYWTLPCPACGQLAPLVWTGLRFNLDDLGTVNHLCPHCGAAPAEKQWKAGSGQGKYLAKYPDRTTRGFHLNSLTSLFTEWGDIVRRFRYAVEKGRSGDISELMCWTALELGEPWSGGMCSGGGI